MAEAYRSRFSVLDIDLENRNRELQDEGFVLDVKEHARKVYQRLMKSLDGFEETHNDEILRHSNGYTMAFGNDEADLWLWIIFYTHNDDPLIELAARAHEETHALHGIGKIGLLQKKLAEIGVNISFNELEDFWSCNPAQRELIAIIGSLMVLRKGGYDLDGAVHKLEFISPYPFDQALSLYKAGTKDHIALVRTKR